MTTSGPSHSGDSGAPIAFNLKGARLPERESGEGLAVRAEPSPVPTNPIQALAQELMSKYRLPMRFYASESGPFLAPEDLIELLHDRELAPEIRSKLGFLERHQLYALATYVVSEPTGKPGETKQRERLMLMMPSHDRHSQQIRSASIFEMEWKDIVTAQLKRELPQLKFERLDILIVPPERYDELKKIASNRDHRNRLLGKIDPNVNADKAFQELVTGAVRDGASDIHIQCLEHGDFRVRFRINGVLKDMHLIRHATGKPLIQRLKILGDMKVDESRLPLDGRIFLTEETVNDKELLKGLKNYSLRASIVFGQQGPTAVLRLLKSAEEQTFKLDRLGFRPHVLHGLEEVLQTPNGVILVTGPTGSGKTSTLYAALKRLDDGETNIVTAEDPVEVSLKGITQVQVNRTIELDFGRILRSFLRQDPDVILVGEIRDAETAEIAVQAALTGHLVFATVHTNDSFGTLPRLQGLGIHGSKLQDTIRAVLSQRLLRRLCCDCRQQVDLAPELNRILGASESGAPAFSEPVLGFKASGKTASGGSCRPCKGTGFTGVFPVAELWVPGLEEKDMMGESNLKHEQLYEAARRNGMVPILHSALWEIRDGVTSLSEGLKVFSIPELRMRREDVVEILSRRAP